MNYEIIKKRLSDEIKQSKYSQAQLAKIVGVGQPMMSSYCTTKKLPALDTFARLCKALDVSADYILGLTDEL